jgi:two-component system, chemotaxis family, CheB/CheR fusion protein
MADGETPIPQLVVIGASAGGVEALSTLVSTLPSKFPAPIVIAQHLDPSRLSHLREILGRRSPLPVRTVENREELQPGVIYVVPADHNVEIGDHVVTLQSEAGRARPSPSIDRLLESAADAYGEQLVGVILTGLGSDGAEGARRVKELGGTVVIQNPQTASHPEMPMSLAPTTVDIVAELEAIGPLLNDLLLGAYTAAKPDDDRRMRSLLDQLRARSGIDFGAYKEPTIRRRLQRRMLDTSNPSLEDYMRYLRRHPQEYDRLASRFLIKVTDFYRDTDLFIYLREHLLPSLIEESRSKNNELRLWSSGCATGEEAYSLAILVSELLGDDHDQFTVRIFATDLDPDAVAFARRGVYPASALKNLSPELQERYFTRLDSAFELRKKVRGMVIFGQHDLGQRAPFPRIDLVLCRNVLIYFTTELQRRALQLFAFALRPGGYLVLGKAESTSPLPEHYTLTQPRLKIFRRHGERVLIPPAPIREGPPSLAGTQVGRLANRQRELVRANTRQGPGPRTAERLEQVLHDLPIGIVVINREFDIQAINATARRLLGIHTPAVGEDVVHLAYRTLGTSLSDAVNAALNGESVHIVQGLTSLPDTPGDVRYLDLSAFVLHPSGESVDQTDFVVLVIADVTQTEGEKRERQATFEEASVRAERVQSLLDESTRTVRQLLQANQELSTSNAALRSTNEELQVGNEEAQAAMEEIETLNEEQQATNEELETLNEELQATVEELNATNEDLQARTLELQDQAREREELLGALGQERKRLAAVLASMADAVLVVDADGDVVLTNAAFQQMFGSDLPPLEDGSGEPIPADTNPRERASRGEAFTQHFTISNPNGSRRWFEATGEPIQSDSDTAGGVVVIRDVSDRSVRQLQEQFVALAGHELRTPLTALRGSLQLLRRAMPEASTEPQLRR